MATTTIQTPLQIIADFKKGFGKVVFLPKDKLNEELAVFTEKLEQAFFAQKSYNYGDTSDLEDEIDDLKSEIEDLEDKISDLESEIRDLQNNEETPKYKSLQKNKLYSNLLLLIEKFPNELETLIEANFTVSGGTCMKK